MGAVSPAMRRDGAYSHARASLLSSCRHASILDHEWFRETVGDDEDTWSRGVSESACVYHGPRLLTLFSNRNSAPAPAS